MVLQRDIPIRIWGFGSPGEEVTVKFDGETAKAATDDDGKWLVIFSPKKAGGPLGVPGFGPGNEPLSIMIPMMRWIRNTLWISALMPARTKWKMASSFKCSRSRFTERHHSLGREDALGNVRC